MSSLSAVRLCFRLAVSDAEGTAPVFLEELLGGSVELGDLWEKGWGNNRCKTDNNSFGQH